MWGVVLVKMSPLMFLVLSVGVILLYLLFVLGLLVHCRVDILCFTLFLLSFIMTIWLWYLNIGVAHLMPLHVLLIVLLNCFNLFLFL